MEKYETDGSCASNTKISRSWLAKRGIATSSATVDDEFYPLDEDKMGVCLILNHKKYDSGATNRNGTDIDKNDLKLFFEKRGFDVIEHNDKKADEISDILQDVKSMDHTNACCFVCCVLTHGNLNYEEQTEVLCARDRSYPTKDLFSPFLDCISLVGKPKMFFIQACRGGQPSRGMNIWFNQSAGSKLLPETKKIGAETFLMCTIPKEADFLIAHSTVPGSLSWKYKDSGSWFIQELCRALNERANDLDLESILTIVRREVALYYETDAVCQFKQIPSLYTTLTRKFKFPSVE